MYNEELKKRYISEKHNETVVPKYFLESLFSKVEIMEEQFNKDVSSFTAYEIIEFYKMINKSDLSSLTVINSHLSQYTQWCLQQNLVEDNQNHFLEINMVNLGQCLNKALKKMKIIPKSTIDDWLSDLVNPRDQFIILGLFEGIKGKNFIELLQLKPSDINGNKASLVTGREIEISSQLKRIIDKCIEEDTYYSISGKGVKKMPLIDNGYIIKDYPNAKLSTDEFYIGRKIYNNVKRILRRNDIDYMNANDITISGELDMIKRRSKDLNMSCIDYISSSYIHEIEEKYDTKIVRSVFIAKYREYLE